MDEIDTTDINMNRTDSEITITKQKYKELVDKSVELEKYKVLNERLTQSMKEKTAELKELKKKLGEMSKNQSPNTDPDANTHKNECKVRKKFEIMCSQQ